MERVADHRRESTLRGLFTAPTNNILPVWLSTAPHRCFLGTNLLVLYVAHLHLIEISYLTDGSPLENGFYIVLICDFNF